MLNMTFAEGEATTTQLAAKKRKLMRACDDCRSKKIKCDGPEKADKRCTRCVKRKVECTYNLPHQKRTSYVQGLEDRLERMEQYVTQLRQGQDPFLNDKITLTVTEQPLSSALASASHSSGERHGHLSPIGDHGLTIYPLTPAGSSEPDDFESADDDVDTHGLVGEMRRLGLQAHSSYHSGNVNRATFVRSHMNQHASTSELPPWLKSTLSRELPVFDNFPPNDLLHHLVELYFRNLNDVFPLLHEPSFKSFVRSGLHLRDGGFGAVVLLVCANGSRYSEDRRVLLEGWNEWHSAGWKWFQVVRDAQKLPVAPAQLHDLQVYALLSLYMHGTHALHATWTLIGTGIRAAIDVGAHRRSTYKTIPTSEQEWWRRAFWMLVNQEWLLSRGLGRPSSLHDEDIDISLPTEVDDEYWSTSEGDISARQPKGKPSKVSFFVAYIRLSQIQDATSRTVYSTAKSKARFSQGDSRWEQRVVTELDSALNQWLDALPDHLRWDPDRVDTLFLLQSATLHAQFYLAQIAAHRVSMSASRQDSPLALPSLIICTTAARSIVQVLEVLHRRIGKPYFKNMSPLFVAGIVLIMNIRGNQRSGHFQAVERDLAYMQKCMDMLQAIKLQMHSSEPLWDVLHELLNGAKITIPPISPGASEKEHVPSEDPRPVPNGMPLEMGIDAGWSSSWPSASLTQPFRPPAAKHNHAIFPGKLPSPRVEGQGTSFLPLLSNTTAGAPLQYSPLSGVYQSSLPFSSASLQLDPCFGSGPGGSVPPSEEPVRIALSSPSMFVQDRMFGHQPIRATSVPDESSRSIEMVMQRNGYGLDPDFTGIDNTLTAWSSAPTSFARWDDWGVYLNSAHERPDASL